MKKIAFIISVLIAFATQAAIAGAGAGAGYDATGIEGIGTTPSVTRAVVANTFAFENSICSKYQASSTMHRLGKAIAKNDLSYLKTENPLLFSIGNLRIIGTIHSLPITIFHPSVRSFLDTMRTHTHLHEHECLPYDENYLRNIGGEASTVEDSVFPHIEKFRTELPEFMKDAFEGVIKMYDPKTIKPWAALITAMFGSQTIGDIYVDGMDDVIGEMTDRRLPLETTKEMFEAMGLPALTAKEIFDAGEEEEDTSKGQDKEDTVDPYAAYLSGDLFALEKEMNASDDDPECMFFKARKPRNINFARNTLRHLAEGAKDEVFFVSMGINHLLGEYGYLNLISALLGKPLLRFNATTATFVPGEIYLDCFAASRPALLEQLRAQGIEAIAL